VNPARVKVLELFHSIRWRLVASYVLVTLLSISMVSLLATEIVKRNIEEQRVKELQANAVSIAQQLQPLMSPIISLAQINSLTQAASFLGDVRVRVIDNNGIIVADSGTPGAQEELVLVYPAEGTEDIPFQSRPLFSLIMPGWDQSLPVDKLDRHLIENLPSDGSFQFIQRATSPWGGRITFSLPHLDSKALPAQDGLNINRSVNLVREPIIAQRESLGYVELSAGQDLSSATVASLQKAFLLAGFGAILAAALVGLWISQRLTSPLRSLQATAGRMAAGDLSARSNYRRSDEIGDLAVQFNLMANQLQENFAKMQAERDSLRRFISDASHELRTPVTALKNFMTLLQGPAGQDQKIQSEFLAESEAQVRQLEWITSNLLNLTRLDAGLEQLDLDYYDLGALMRKAVKAISSQVKSKNIMVVINEPIPPIDLFCDAHRLELVLTNLLDNALKFTEPGGEIVIGAEQSSDKYYLWVRDTGIGITEEEIPFIFDRFYRGRQPGKEGSGLGLAIAKSLVEAQSGNIIVESTPGKGSRFILEFPKIA
jgi:signal transduction histidine kinase